MFAIFIDGPFGKCLYVHAGKPVYPSREHAEEVLAKVNPRVEPYKR